MSNYDNFETAFNAAKKLTMNIVELHVLVLNDENKSTIENLLAQVEIDLRAFMSLVSDIKKKMAGTACYEIQLLENLQKQINIEASCTRAGALAVLGRRNIFEITPDEMEIVRG